MKHLSKIAQKTFDRLTKDMAPGTAKKLDNAKGTYMALSVERLTETTYSMAHYFEQNGDLCPDPDMEFWRAPDGLIYPTAITQSFGGYRRAVFFDDDGAVRCAPRQQRELCSFAAMWLKNIKSQQF